MRVGRFNLIARCDSTIEPRRNAGLSFARHDQDAENERIEQAVRQNNDRRHGRTR
jgi:hypothetical protein